MTVPPNATVRPSLAGLRVVELGQGIAESFAGKMFAAQGADVIKVESPQTDGDARRTGPDAESHRFGQSPGYFHYLNMSKRSVALNTGNAEGTRLLERLLDVSDVLVDGTRGDDLLPVTGDTDAARERFPRLVQVSITPFGRTGPYADFAATEIVLHATSGEMKLSGLPDRPPLQKGGHFAHVHGGLHGYLAAMAALIARKKTGRGQFIDVSIAEAWMSVAGSALKKQTYTGESPARGENKAQFPGGLRRCADGWVIVGGRGGRRNWWPPFAKMIGWPELDDPELATEQGRAANAAMLERVFTEWLMARPKVEVYERAQSVGLAAAYVADASDILNSKHLRSRAYFEKTRLGDGGEIEIPSRPYRAQRMDWSNRPAPALGEHTRDVFIDELGVKTDELDRLAEMKVV